MKNIKKVLLVIIVICAIICAASLIYVGNYYHADEAAYESIIEPDPGVAVLERGSQRLDFVPNNPSAGLIFYPGAKVQFESYAPLMEECAKRGILCVLYKMPGNLAVLDINRASKDDPRTEYPEVEKWYMAGHSLGGAMAADYIAEHAEEYDGLILLAAFSTKDLTETELSALSIYGSEDHVLNAEKYESYLGNLPSDYEEVVIEGGCHAGFGEYGPQKGDGEASISAEDQRTQTAQVIADFVL